LGSWFIADLENNLKALVMSVEAAEQTTSQAEEAEAKEKKDRFKENLHITFLSVAIISFAIGIAVNYYTLKRLNAGK